MLQLKAGSRQRLVSSPTSHQFHHTPEIETCHDRELRALLVSLSLINAPRGLDRGLACGLTISVSNVRCTPHPIKRSLSCTVDPDADETVLFRQVELSLPFGLTASTAYVEKYHVRSDTSDAFLERISLGSCRLRPQRYLGTA